MTRKAVEPSTAFLLLSLSVRKLFLAVLVSLVEFVDASGGVNELDFACVERVGCVGDLDLDNRIFDSVNNEGLFSLCARAGYEHGVVRHILESYKAVGFGMKSFFHFFIVFNDVTFQSANITLFFRYSNVCPLFCIPLRSFTVSVM